MLNISTISKNFWEFWFFSLSPPSWPWRLQIACFYKTVFPSRKGERRKRTLFLGLSLLGGRKISPRSLSADVSYIVLAWWGHMTTLSCTGNWERECLLWNPAGFRHFGTHWGWWEEVSSESLPLLAHMAPFGKSQWPYGIMMLSQTNDYALCLRFAFCFLTFSPWLWPFQKTGSVSELSCFSTIQWLSFLWSQQ